MRSLCILGRQPALGLAELESLFGAERLKSIGHEAVLIDIAPKEINFSRLGGCLKLATQLTTISSTNWQDIEAYLIEHVPKHVCCIPEGKLVLGLSAYGLSVKPAIINATSLKLKKVVKASDRPVRIVPNPQTALSSAQVLYNKLFTSHNWELLLVADGNQTHLAQTVVVQDINAYAARDQTRPKRDARVGMLPPKLAQIIVNLAGKHVIPKGAKLNSLYQPHNACLLDPFCGTGVILQEALLMGYSAYGTDYEPRMVDYSKINLDWLASRHAIQRNYLTEVGNATTHQWRQPVDLVASETYLGRAFTSLPGPQILAQTIRECDLIIRKFLKNIHGQITSGTRLCLGVPAWQTTPGRFQHLPLIDQLGNLGYNRVSFEHVSDNQLLYYREGQIVARQLLVLTRK